MLNLSKILSMVAIFAVSQLAFANDNSKAFDNSKALDNLSIPEQVFLEHSGLEPKYSDENFNIIETDNIPELGKLAALSLIDTLNKKPNSVISLPTGRTPEYFIKYLKYYKENWSNEHVQNELKKHGIIAKNFPDTSQTKFVQMDEFYALATNHQKSFINFINKYYISTLNLKPHNVYLMDINSKGVFSRIAPEKIFKNGIVDLSLIKRTPKSKLEIIQKQALNEAILYCKQYESNIRRLGGIDFFLGGIGYDGHIAFNIKGSDHNSKTRLLDLNYQSSAQAAIDLGGMQYSRNRTVLSIGLDTIKFNKNAKIIIMAQGEIKSQIVKDALIGKKHKNIPATAFLNHNGVRFYLTKDTAHDLPIRSSAKLINRLDKRLDDETIDKIVIDIALKENKQLSKLTKRDLEKYPIGKIISYNFDKNLNSILRNCENRLKNKIKTKFDFPKLTSFLHTAPHHDDIMLSYYPIVKTLFSDYQNHFAYLTSGFNAVTDEYVIDKLKNIKPDYLNLDYERLLGKYRDNYLLKRDRNLKSLENKIIAKKLSEVFTKENIYKNSGTLLYKYFPNKVPGNKDINTVQKIKGIIRETEVDRLWALTNISNTSITHLRTKFYNGNDYNNKISLEKDVKPFVELVNKTNPKVVTVALDPKGTGPDTHFKVLQIVANSLKQTKEIKPLVIGYRNVWHRFGFDEANIMIPVSEEELSLTKRAFLKSFSTQAHAQFPSPFFDGDFASLSVSNLKEQYRQLKVLLGTNFFITNSSLSVKNAAGFILLKQLNKKELLAYAELLNYVNIDRRQ